MQISVTRNDGTLAPWNADKINRSIERAARDLINPVAMAMQIATEMQLVLREGITTEELDNVTIDTAVQNIKDDPDYDKVAVRLLLKTVYRRVVGEYDKNSALDLKAQHASNFHKHIDKLIDAQILDTRMIGFDMAAIADALDPDRDELFNYAGLSSLLNRYALKDKQQKPAETPQYCFMRIAMGLSYNEKDPTSAAIRFYDKMSKLKYLAGGSTNLASGTTVPALSNCFLLQVEDTMDHIAKSTSDVLRISKSSGGIGVSMTKLRASGSPLSKSNTASSGPTPFAKIMDVAIRAVQRGGKKVGALCFYMENWHLDFPEFIRWRENNGDENQRMRTASTAAWISDEFMKRVQNNEAWYLFDPKEVKDLIELYGAAFSKRYGEYCKMADQGMMRTYQVMPAKELWTKMITALQSTGHPWLTWKDPMNVRALNDNTGTIHMSNLCTEIALPQDKDNIAVCNLLSTNIATHISHKEVMWNELEDTVRTGIRQLDNLIDINYLSVKEAAHSDKQNRAVGLGVMGFADALERLGIPYDSKHAVDFADKLIEFISYMAIDESANLAQERGSYANFEGSGWSKGLVPIDTVDRLEKDRGVKVTVQRTSKNKHLDWKKLREKVKKGMRNSCVMAVAPNANIGLVAGTTPGFDPRFAQIFARNKISGKYTDLNPNLVKDLKNLDIWDEVKEQIIINRGDIASIEEIPDSIKALYKTSFTINPKSYIEVAARAQKWIDQALSRNIYLRERNVDVNAELYMFAWERGLKTTYYLHMEQQHSAEQSTVAVNKSSALGKRGFAVLRDAPKVTPIIEETGEGPVIMNDLPAVEEITSHTTVLPTKHTPHDTFKPKAVATPKPFAIAMAKEDDGELMTQQACPMDPAERAQCDSCQ